MEISIIIKIAAGIAGLIGAFFALIKFYHWLYPISVRPSFTLNFDSGKTPDSISAIVTNKSSETHYMVSCSTRGTYSIWHILKRHITRPLLKPSLYPNVWYNGPVYGLMKSEPIKIEHFWAAPSRDLIKSIEIIEALERSLKNSEYAFYIEEYHRDRFTFCKSFLSKSGGSAIPPYTEKLELYYTIPMFFPQSSIKIENKNDIADLKAIGSGSYAHVYKYILIAFT